MARKQSTDDNGDRRLLGGVSIGVYRSNLLPAINPVSVSSQLGWLHGRCLLAGRVNLGGIGASGIVVGAAMALGIR